MRSAILSRDKKARGSGERAQLLETSDLMRLERGERDAVSPAGGTVPAERRLEGDFCAVGVPFASLDPQADLGG